MKIGRDPLARAVGPYAQDHSAYLQMWWDWVMGSTPFFWIWPAHTVRRLGTASVTPSLESLVPL